MKQIVEIVIVLGAVVLYLTPAMEADVQNHPDAFAITVANILLGWTIVGWVATFLWARRPRAGRVKRLPHLVRRFGRSTARATIEKLVTHAALRASSRRQVSA
ncbi:superinfection immunity protein [Paraburkholderia sp. GAS42]|uniref:superinfection immunity protein n=1 Tax=Paraburkholderia sp. GAS42 TaxID=3035135 RepID=UPI003D1FD91C